MKLHFGPVVVLGTFFAALARAQTTTITDAAGNTIIEVITIDPVQEIPVTSTIETIPAAAAQTTTTTTPLDQQQGPVAQPAATEAGQTTFRYTTTDAAGDTIVVTDTFTPSFAPTAGTTPIPTFVGTILSVNQWLSMVGTNTVPVANAAIERWKFPRTLLSIGSAMLAGAVGGVWIVLG